MTSSRTSASVRSVNLDGTAIGGVGFSMTEVLKSHLTTSTDVNQQTEFLKGISPVSLWLRRLYTNRQTALPL